MDSTNDEGDGSPESEMGREDDRAKSSMPMTSRDKKCHITEDNRMEQVKRHKNASRRDSNLEPYVGMEFASHEDARSFYNSYAMHVGFGTRINYSHRSQRDRSMIAQQYVCDKEGFRVSKEGPRKRTRAVTRVGCKASMAVKKLCPGKWVVKSFEREHNHELLSPNQVQTLRSHRGSLDAVRNRLIDTRKAGNISSLEQEHLGLAGTVQEKNFVSGDAQAVLDYFKLMQNENQSFFYAIQVDKEDKLTNALWIDATSRMAYNYFGEVVTFDSTYLMNKYGLPFTPFVGVNHHGLPVLFGCALLADETRSSFVWLFKTWIAAMSRRHPVTIITHHDREIQAAVAEVLPETQHCFCISHIQRKLPEKLSHVYTRKNFKEVFQKCIFQTDTIPEFESEWGLILDKFDLRKNDWFQLLYEDRQYWVPVYLRATFFAEMPAAQRSESVLSFFDDFVNVRTSLEEFVRQYDIAQDNLYSKEVQADFETMSHDPHLKTSSPMEKQAAGLYTKEIFKKFQVELFECFGYVANKVAEDEAICTYKVAQFGEEKKFQTVTFNFSEMRGSCSCLMFEYTGILCRHVLNVFKVANIFMLPSHYILKRWTRNAKIGVLLDDHNVDTKDNCQQSMIARYNDLCHRSIKIAEEGAKSMESYSVAMCALRGTLEEVVSMNDSVTGFVQPCNLISECNSSRLLTT